jgi:hypothetical protein
MSKMIKTELYDIYNRSPFESFMKNTFPVCTYEEYTSKRYVPALPKKYIINKDAAILFWSNDKQDKTIVKRTKKDKPDKKLAFLTAYFQKHSGMTKTQANKYLDELVVLEEKEERK